MTYTTYKQIVIDKLKAILGDDNTVLFSDVLGVQKTGDVGYPFAIVTERTGSANILDTHRNEREWQFNIVIHQGITANTTQEDAYATLLDATDKVIKALDEDPMLLDGNEQAQCMWVRCVPVAFEFGTEEAPVHRALIAVAIKNTVNRYR